MSRLGRSQPVQPTGWHGFVDSGAAGTPPPAQFVPLDADRHHLRPALQPVVAAHGFVDSGVGVPGTVPPQPLSLDRADQRTRYLPLAPTSIVGIPADQFVTVVTPPEPLSLDRIEQRARYLPQPATSIVGFPADQFVQVVPAAPTVVAIDERGRFRIIPPSSSAHGFIDSGVGVPGTAPPPPFNIDRAPERIRRQTPDPVSISGVLSGLVAPPAATPPAPLSIDRVDQRARYRALDPVSISGVLAGIVAPAATPPGPFVVPLEERRRFLTALPPEYGVGFDNVVPPAPKVIEQDDSRHRRPPLEAFTTTPDAAVAAPAPATPPPPYVVPIDSRGRFLVVLPSTGQHGFVDPGPGPVGTTPPPPLNVDRPKLDPRYTPLASVQASGLNIPALAGSSPTGGDDPNWFIVIHP